jgi:hypothetical protein
MSNSRAKHHFIGARVDAETYKKLRAIAKQDDRSLSKTFVRILSAGVNHLTEPPITTIVTGPRK